jgi:hypothetical protein
MKHPATEAEPAAEPSKVQTEWRGIARAWDDLAAVRHYEWMASRCGTVALFEMREHGSNR